VPALSYCICHSGPHAVPRCPTLPSSVVITLVLSLALSRLSSLAFTVAFSFILSKFLSHTYCRTGLHLSLSFVHSVLRHPCCSYPQMLLSLLTNSGLLLVTIVIDMCVSFLCDLYFVLHRSYRKPRIPELCNRTWASVLKASLPSSSAATARVTQKTCSLRTWCPLKGKRWSFCRKWTRTRAGTEIHHGLTNAR
jgi:hypothetical protein